jgi:spore coat-associated protein N
MSRKKLVTTMMAAMLILVLAVGAGTYAFFSSSATNGPNMVQAGTVEITSTRDDVPNVGPMFYTESVEGQVGAMPTGLWAPGDKHTRGIFLENVGSLDAKLKSLSVIPTNAQAEPVSSSSTDPVDVEAYNNAILFAQQARVKIWEVKEYDPTRGLKPLNRMDGTEMDELMDLMNVGYQRWLDQNPTADLSRQEYQASLLNFVNAYLLEELNKRNGSVNNRLFQVVKMYDKPLIHFVNNTPIDISEFGIEIEPTEACLLAFTVEFRKNPPGNSGIDPNSMQGKSVYFTFGSYWEQSRNN